MGFVYYDGGKIRFNNSPLQTYLEDRMMVGSLIGLDDTWQAGGMPHSVGHLGQIMHVREMVETQDWEPIILPPAGAMGAGHKAILRQLHLQAPQAEAATAVFPENQKQSCLRKRRSRFAQPGEAEQADALRVTLVERGGREESVLWLPLPQSGGSA